MFSTLLREDRTVDISDSSAACRLKSFTRRVLKKVDSLLIHEPPKQCPAKSVLHCGVDGWRLSPFLEYLLLSEVRC